MNDRRRLALLIVIMATVALAVGTVAIHGLYAAAVAQQRSRLVETAQSQARLIEAIARFDARYSQEDHPEGASAATLSQIIDAHEHYRGLGHSGEFTLGRREGDRIVFLLRHRHYDLDNPKPIPFDSEWGEPMRRALSGGSGSLIGLDYRGELVLAAHEPVAELDLGIVAKIDMAEIREPFARASQAAGGVGILCILAGAGLFLQLVNPLIRRLEGAREKLDARVKERTAELQEAIEILHGEIADRKHAEAALRESQERFEQSVTVSGSGT